MAELEQDLVRKFLAGDEIKAPEEKPKMPDAEKKDIIVWDADNTFWDWTRNRAVGVDNMAQVTASLLKADIDEVRKSFGRVFDAARTFDHPEILENSDLVINKMLTIVNSRKENSTLSLVKMMKELIQLVAANIKAYHSERKIHYGLYAYMWETLAALHMSSQYISGNRGAINQIVFTNAPEDKVTSRSKHFKVGRFFSKFFTQPPASVRYPDSDKMIYVREGERDKPIYAKYREIIKTLREIQKQSTSSKYDGVMSTLQLYSTDYDVQPLEDQSKPFIDLAEILGITSKEVKERVVVIGDGESDMLLAVQNSCTAIRAEWGIASERDKKLLRLYGAESERRNVPDEEGIKKLKRKEKRNKDSIIEADSPLQVLDLFGIPRPPHADVIPALHAINKLMSNTQVNRHFIAQILNAAKNSPDFQKAATEEDYARIYDSILRENGDMIKTMAKQAK